MNFDLMEMQLIVTAFLVLASFIFMLIIRLAPKEKEGRQEWPPRPPKLPIIGHLHHLAGSLPHRALRKLSKRYGPIIHVQLGSVSSIVISSAEAAKQVLKVQDPACADRPTTIGAKILFYNYSDVVFSPYNDYWRQMRKLCILELLSAKNVRSYASIRKDEASRLVKSIQIQSSSGEAINITKMIFAFTCSITCRTAFGKEVRDRDTLVGILKNAVVLVGGFELADLFPYLEIFSWNTYKLLRLRRKLDAILDVIVEEHRLKQRGEFGGEDIIDVLLRVQRTTGEVIANDNIKAIIFDVFSAGSETSSTTVDWAMAELIKNPRGEAMRALIASSRLASAIPRNRLQGLASAAFVWPQGGALWAESFFF
ncbi:hypothetical protein RD792_007977 [Penstemon davidsonii]|uniref:Uncharacterized protein n=1 Tax=Penstemon davidsonii TaxID=160366 RepID=A0ABR0D7S2_9LAMI|nr:hypothetical protein RD792_007977 [Penstemon davidsonii]